MSGRSDEGCEQDIEPHRVLENPNWALKNYMGWNLLWFRRVLKFFHHVGIKADDGELEAARHMAGTDSLDDHHLVQLLDFLGPPAGPPFNALTRLFTEGLVTACTYYYRCDSCGSILENRRKNYSPTIGVDEGPALDTSGCQHCRAPVACLGLLPNKDLMFKNNNRLTTMERLGGYKRWGIIDGTGVVRGSGAVPQGEGRTVYIFEKDPVFSRRMKLVFVMGTPVAAKEEFALKVGAGLGSTEVIAANALLEADITRGSPRGSMMKLYTGDGTAQAPAVYICQLLREHLFALAMRQDGPPSWVFVTGFPRSGSAVAAWENMCPWVAENFAAVFVLGETDELDALVMESRLFERLSEQCTRNASPGGGFGDCTAAAIVDTAEVFPRDYLGWWRKFCFRTMRK